MAHPSAPYGAAQPFEPCDVAIDVPLAVEAPRNGRSAVLVKGVLLVGAALVLAAVVSQQNASPAATASTTSVDTTTLFRGREMPKCGPTDDACCDQFSPSRGTRAAVTTWATVSRPGAVVHRSSTFIRCLGGHSHPSMAVNFLKAIVCRSSIGPNP